MKNKLIGIIICMLLIGTVAPVTGTSLIDKTTSSNISDNTLYVGGSGAGNYTSIQEAINDSVDGDTVFVYNEGSPYYENIIVNKSINLMGENKDNTIIDGYENGNVVSINADWVTVSGFTIENGSYYFYLFYAGIYICSNNSTIMDNIISNNWWGIALLYYNNNTITGNTFIRNLFCGILVGKSSANTITDNTISTNDYGILLEVSSNNNIIYHNNFIDNFLKNARDECNNNWDDGKYGNYWSDYKEKYPNAKKSLLKPWMWNTPYEIEGGDNKDICPLIEQWPHSKPRTIPRNTASYSSYLLRFLEQFPILQKILCYIL